MKHRGVRYIQVQCSNSETGLHSIAVGRKGSLKILNHDLQDELLLYRMSGVAVDCLAVYLYLTGAIKIEARLQCPVASKIFYDSQTKREIRARRYTYKKNHKDLLVRPQNAVTRPDYVKIATEQIANSVFQTLCKQMGVKTSCIVGLFSGQRPPAEIFYIKKDWLTTVYKKKISIVCNCFITGSLTETITLDGYERNKYLDFIGIQPSTDVGLIRKIIPVSKRELKLDKKQPFVINVYKPKYRM